MSSRCKSVIMVKLQSLSSGREVTHSIGACSIRGAALHALRMTYRLASMVVDNVNMYLIMVLNSLLPVYRQTLVFVNEKETLCRVARIGNQQHMLTGQRFCFFQLKWGTWLYLERGVFEEITFKALRSRIYIYIIPNTHPPLYRETYRRTFTHWVVYATIHMALLPVEPFISGKGREVGAFLEGSALTSFNELSERKIGHPPFPVSLPNRFGQCPQHY